MYSIYIKSSFKKEIDKVKDKKALDNIKNKMEDVAKTLELNPNHYKNLRRPLQKCKRVHVNDSFVMIFQVNKKEKKVTFYHYKHHDEIYLN